MLEAGFDWGGVIVWIQHLQGKARIAEYERDQLRAQLRKSGSDDVKELLTTIEWLNDQLQSAFAPLVCPVCTKPYVTIPQAVILERVDGHHYSDGGEAWCWGRGDCAKRIVVDEQVRRRDAE